MTRETDYSVDNYTGEFKNSYERSPNYKAGSSWDDYEPAYRYSHDRYHSDLRGKRFEDVENDLEHGWEKAKGKSRLAWADAKHAIKEGWNKLERALPGDADRDGR